MEETLKQILGELQLLNNRVGGLEQGQKNLEEGQLSLHQGQKNLEERQINLEERQINLEQGQKKLEERQINLEEEQRSLREEMKLGFAGMNKKLDAISIQVAHNTEQEVKLNEVISKVEAHNIDIELLKKTVSNQ